MTVGYYNDIVEFVNALNEAGIPYVILRNYENFKDANLYIDGHGDVDLLCVNGRKMAEHLGAQIFHVDDGVHFYVTIAGDKVSLDLRSVGDGYYCSLWQDDMLSRRVQKDGVWVMCDVDYFYSLIHHSVLQKRRLSEEYSKRLTMMAEQLGITINSATERGFIQLLETYMSANGYQYVYPTDYMVPLRTSIIDKRLLCMNHSLAFAHWKFDTKINVIEFLVKVKHLLEGKGFKYV